MKKPRITTPSTTLVGTALLLDDDEKPDQARLPVWKQEVKDSEGRRRFHGAFTGGFSAGYFNSVGSKEGWAPSSFVSSRKQRFQLQQKKEDFMDEEDYTETMIGGKALSMRAQFDTFGRTSQEIQPSQVVTAPSRSEAILHNLISATASPIGVKLLQLMGWREGQGIGPRKQRTIKRQETKAQSSEAGKRVYGLAVPLHELQQQMAFDESEEDIYAAAYTAPPTDTEIIEYNAKSDFYGLGYDPYTASGAANMRDHGLKGKRSETTASFGGGFGLGVFEDPDEPDPYTNDTLEAYDTELQEETFQTKQRKIRPNLFQANVNEVCSDRTAVLSGYTLSSCPLASGKWFAPPEVPRDFKPFHFFGTTLYSDDAPVRNMDAVTRGHILGEKPLPSASNLTVQSGSPRSVFDLVSRQDRERLFAIKATVDQHQQSSLALPSLPTSFSHRFSGDANKQMRFRYFLLQRSGQHVEPLPAHFLGNLTEWEKDKEKEEFQHAANEIAAVPAPMASRFTSAGKLDLSGKEEEVESHEQAATMQMFGKLTREEQDWHPENLLSKRFNLRPVAHIGKKRTEQKSSLPVLADLTSILPSTPISFSGPTRLSTTEESPKIKETYELEEQETEERPSLDLFKAIFEPESESESESEFNQEQPQHSTRTETNEIGTGSDHQQEGKAGSHVAQYHGTHKSESSHASRRKREEKDDDDEKKKKQQKEDKRRSRRKMGDDDDGDDDDAKNNRRRDRQRDQKERGAERDRARRRRRSKERG